MLYASNATDENYKLSLPAPPPPSTLNRQVPKYVSLLQDTGLFRFFLDKILISLAVWFFLVPFYSSSNCINIVQQSIIVVLFFPCPALTDLCVSSSASNKETIGMAEKNIKPHLLIKWQKMKRYNNACMRFSMAQAWRWCWRWKVWRLSMTFVLQTMLCQDADQRGEQKSYFKKRKKQHIIRPN